MTIPYADQLDRNPPLPRHFEEIFRDHLRPALVAIAAAKNQSGNPMGDSSLAWIHFAIGCITLYVPDRPFDPNCRQLLERQQHNNAKDKLENKIAALRSFEKCSLDKTLICDSIVGARTF